MRFVGRHEYNPKSSFPKTIRLLARSFTEFHGLVGIVEIPFVTSTARWLHCFVIIADDMHTMHVLPDEVAPGFSFIGKCFEWGLRTVLYCTVLYPVRSK